MQIIDKTYDLQKRQPKSPFLYFGQISQIDLKLRCGGNT